MGSLVECHCPDCGYGESLSLGQGMAWAAEAWLCRRCKRIVEVGTMEPLPDLEWEDPPPPGTCVNCRGADLMPVIEGPGGRWQCPRCFDWMEITDAGIWD